MLRFSLCVALLLVSAVAVAGNKTQTRLADLVERFHRSQSSRERSRIVDDIGELRHSETCGESLQVLARIAAGDCDDRVSAQATDELGDAARKSKYRGAVQSAMTSAGVPFGGPQSFAKPRTQRQADELRRNLSK